MVQWQRAHLDASFAARSDTTRRAMLERLRASRHLGETLRKPRPKPEAQRATDPKLLVAMTGKASAAKGARYWRTRNYGLLVFVAAAFAVSAHTPTAGGQAMRTPESKGYAKVNDVELYYEVNGDGPPLIMLAGAVTPWVMFGWPLPEMSNAATVCGVHATDR